MLRTSILPRLFKATHIERLLLILLIALTAAYTAQAQSALDGFDSNANGTIYVVVVQPDGRILIGGDFTTLSPNGGAPVTRNRIARLNPDGTLDTAFNPNASNAVFAIVLQADGKILVGGIFNGPNSIGGQTRNRIARLNVDGTADLSFDPNANAPVRSFAVLANGKVLAGGNFTTIGGQARNRIARLDATTGLADSWNPNADSSIHSIAVQSDGMLLVGGFFTTIGGQPRVNIARLDPTTGMADSWNPNPAFDPDNSVLSIAVQADGKILAGGSFLNIGGQPRNCVARLDATTGLADSWNPNTACDVNFGSYVNSIALQADGKVLAGGGFSSIGGQTRNRIARLDTVTGLADSFDPNVNGAVNVIAVQADGKILAGGSFSALSPNGGATVTRNNIARLETEGRLDRTLDLSMVGSYVTATAMQPDGKILIGGFFATILGVTRNNIARLNADGSLDMAFNPNANSQVDSLVVLSDGRILAGGSFTSIGGQPRNYIARLDGLSGTADTFDPNANSFVESIAMQADGKILVGGLFSNIGGQTRSFIGRLDPLTGAADSFNPFADDTVFSIVVQVDGKVLVGGDFSSIGGQVRNRIARLDPVTGLADSFNQGLIGDGGNAGVTSIAVQTDGKVLAGGDFTTIGG